MGEFATVEALGPGHDTSSFDCGDEELSDFLRTCAVRNIRTDGSRTFVVLKEDRIVGFYTLVVGSARREHAPEQAGNGPAAGPIGIMILARLGIAVEAQGRGLGKALLKDAMIRTARASEQIDAGALAVHARHERARSFCREFGFEPSPTDPLHLVLPMKDVRSWLREEGYLE